MMAKVKESHCQARHEDDQRKSIVQQVMQKSTDFLRRIIVPVEEQGGVTLSYACPHCHHILRHGREFLIHATFPCNFLCVLHDS